MPDSTEDRRQQHYELLKKSRDALSAEQEAEAAVAAATAAAEEPPIAPEDDRREGDRRQGGGRRKEDLGTYMYRGREVKRGLGVAPGAGSNAARANWSNGEDGDDKTEAIKKALTKLSQLHAEGKVSDKEYEEKKQKLLSRL